MGTRGTSRALETWETCREQIQGAAWTWCVQKRARLSQRKWKFTERKWKQLSSCQTSEHQQRALLPPFYLGSLSTKVADCAQKLPLSAGAAFNWDRALESSNSPTSLVIEIFQISPKSGRKGMTAAPETEVLQSVFKPTVPLTQHFIKLVISEAAQKS